MSTVAHNAPSSRVYNALYEDAHGYLSMDGEGTIWFRNSSTEALTVITTENFENLMCDFE
jgi:hypothetical protein